MSRNTSMTLLLFLFLFIGHTAFAQQATKPGFKETGTATLWSVLITGGGQFYAGESGKGLALLGGSLGSVILGAALSTDATCDISGFNISCNEANFTPLYAGIGASLALWIYGIMDAPKAAKRTNAKNGYVQRNPFKIRPIALLDAKILRPGVQLSVTF